MSLRTRSYHIFFCARLFCGCQFQAAAEASDGKHRRLWAKMYLKYQMLITAEVFPELGENSLRYDIDWRNPSDVANKGMAAGFKRKIVVYVLSENKRF